MLVVQLNSVRTLNLVIVSYWENSPIRNWYKLPAHEQWGSAKIIR